MRGSARCPGRGDRTQARPGESGKGAQMTGVSVLLAVHNGGRYLAEAIDSVLEQTCPPEELIVVDDGSDDDSPRVLQRYAGRIVHLHQTNQGQTAAFNRAIAAAKGEVLAFQTPTTSGAWKNSNGKSRRCIVTRGRGGVRADASIRQSRRTGSDANKDCAAQRNVARGDAHLPADPAKGVRPDWTI